MTLQVERTHGPSAAASAGLVQIHVALVRELQICGMNVPTQSSYISRPVSLKIMSEISTKILTEQSGGVGKSAAVALFQNWLYVYS